MVRLRTVVGALLVTVIGAALWQRFAVGDNRPDNGTEGGVQYSSCSSHTGQHPGYCGGYDEGWVCLTTNCPASPDSEWVKPMKPNYLVKKPVTYKGKTPFVALTAESEGIKDASGNIIGYRSSAGDKQSWSRSTIEPDNMKIRAFYGLTSVLQKTTVSGHTQVIMVQVPKMDTPVSGPLLATLSTLVNRPGVISLVDDGQGGVTVERDAYGEAIWAVEPSPGLLFASSLAYAAGGGVTYTYSLQNLTNVSKDFAFVDLTAPGHESGWAGTVAANETETLSFTDSPAQAIFEQNATASFTNTEDGTSRLERSLPHYCPESRVTYRGTCTIQSVEYQAGVGNVVTFLVAAQNAGGWCVTRTNAGEAELVGDSEDTPIAIGLHTFIDPTPPAGANAYRIRTGTRSNCVCSQSVAIVNN